MVSLLPGAVAERGRKSQNGATFERHHRLDLQIERLVPGTVSISSSWGWGEAHRANAEMVGGGRQESIETEIHVVNPMFGGGFDACEPNTKNPVRATVVRGSPAILGATVVSKHAGELIFPTVEMLQKGRGVKSLFGLILPYPTYMEMWNRAALTCQWVDWR